MKTIMQRTALLSYMAVMAVVAADSRNLQEYRVVFDPFLVDFTSSTQACSSEVAQTMRDGLEDCIRAYSRDRCQIKAAYIGLGGATCASDTSITVNRGAFNFNGVDALPATIQNCIREATYSEACLTAVQAVLPEVGTIAYRAAPAEEEENSSPMPMTVSVPTPVTSPTAVTSPTTVSMPSALTTTSPPSDVLSSVPSDVPVSTPTISPTPKQRISFSVEPTTTLDASSGVPSVAPTEERASEIPSLVPVVEGGVMPPAADAPPAAGAPPAELPGAPPRGPPAAPPAPDAPPVPTLTSAIVNEPVPKSQKSKTVPITTVAVGFAAVLVLVAFVLTKKRRNSSKASFAPMEDDDESNASGFIGIAPLQSTNPKNGDLEQAVEISLKERKSPLNTTFSTAASNSPSADVSKRYRTTTPERDLPRPDVSPRRRSRNYENTPFGADDELPSNPTPTPVTKEICGTSWWKQMNATKVRNPYTAMDELCCPQSSVPGMILDKATVRDDVSDFELDGAWDPDDTSVPSRDDDDSEHFQTTASPRSVASNQYTTSQVHPAMVTPSPNSKHNSSSLLPPLRKKNEGRLGASSRFQMDSIVMGSEKEV